MRIVAGLLAAAVVFAPHANAADHSRDALWEAMVTYGPGICSSLDTEPILNALSGAEGQLLKAGYTDSEAGTIVGDAIAAYCPNKVAAVRLAIKTN